MLSTIYCLHARLNLDSCTDAHSVVGEKQVILTTCKDSSVLCSNKGLWQVLFQISRRSPLRRNGRNGVAMRHSAHPIMR